MQDNGKYIGITNGITISGHQKRKYKMGSRHMEADRFDRQMDQPGEGRLQQELVTYYRKDGKLTKETITRCFFKNNKYIDSITTEVLDILD
jgi:hypothetical protein